MDQLAASLKLSVPELAPRPHQEPQRRWASRNPPMPAHEDSRAHGQPPLWRTETQMKRPGNPPSRRVCGIYHIHNSIIRNAQACELRPLSHRLSHKHGAEISLGCTDSSKTCRWMTSRMAAQVEVKRPSPPSSLRVERPSQMSRRRASPPPRPSRKKQPDPTHSGLPILKEHLPFCPPLPRRSS